MRIILIGRAAFGKEVLEAIIDGGGNEVVAVFVSGGATDQEDPLYTRARDLGVPVFQPSSFRSPDVYRQFSSFEPELCIMAYVTEIIPVKILQAPKEGTIQYHPSLLPKHRGASAINWAIIFGEQRTGITIFWPDEGVDTGPILLQKEVSIAPDDTAGSLYYNKLFPQGVQAIKESISVVKQGKAPKIPQDECKATYEHPCTERDARIDWLKETIKVYNLIRGTDPQPGATTFWDDMKLKIYDCEPIYRHTEQDPGTVVEIGEASFTVATNDGGIKIKRIRQAGTAKISAAEFRKNTKLVTGVKFEY